MKRFGFVLLLAGCATSPAPPSLEYGAQRESTGWIEIPMGKIPVDKGLEWQGIKVYLSMMDILIAVDTTTGRVLWNEMVGAFWNRLAFKEIDIGASSRIWAVELRPRRTEKEGADLVQYHDLRSGKLIEPHMAGQGPDVCLPITKEWHGTPSRLDKSFYLVVSTAENWRTLRSRMFDGLERGPKDEPIDFGREMVVVLSDGDSFNCGGISAAQVDESEDRIRLRVKHHYYQTFRSGNDPAPLRPDDRPYGLIVLPRHEGKPVLVEYNHQQYIGGPPIWKEKVRLMLTGDAGRELDALPKE